MAPHERIFKSMADGRPIVLLDHVRALMRDRDDVEVHVGCDSHNHGRHTVYATTVVLRYHRNGAQVVYHREKSAKVDDLWTRLWGEVERSLMTAELLREEGHIRVHRIDMDLNSDARYASNKLHMAAVGFVRAHGFEPMTKPDLLIASWAANVLCNGAGAKHEAPVPLGGTGAT
ncbi:MAG: hypothetical protein IPP83_04665 [Flavobacteriales bacterium]|nr:hypothetical protein [Flavobacteriales bacterium]